MINATGVYVDAVRRLDDPADAAAPLLTPSQGAHLVLDRSFLPGESAMLVPRTDDGRVLFTIPWHDRVLVGTTDTPVTELAIEPRPLREEIAYLLDHVARYLARRPRASDVLSTFAGLRPLLRGRHRRLDGQAVARACRGGLQVGIDHHHGREMDDLSTDGDRRGGPRGARRRPPRPSLDDRPAQAPWLGRPSLTEPTMLFRFTARTPRRCVRSAPSTPDGINGCIPTLPYRAGEVVWAARHEAARSVEDVLARRTRALFLDARASIEAAPSVAAILAAELARDQAWQDRQVAQFRELAAGYLVPADS